MISKGESIWYVEYKDHGRVYSLDDLPLILWCVGKIAKETDDFLAVVCCGTKEQMPSSMPALEIILKSAIIKKELIYIVV